MQRYRLSCDSHMTCVFQRHLEGRVIHEKEKFEKLAKEKEMTEKECRAKEEKLFQVRELIRNSPLSTARMGTQSIPNTPLKATKSNKDNKTQEGVRKCHVFIF